MKATFSTAVIDLNARAVARYLEEASFGGDVEEVKSEWRWFVTIEFDNGRCFSHFAMFTNEAAAKEAAEFFTQGVEGLLEGTNEYWTEEEPCYGSESWEGNEWRLYDSEERSHHLGWH